MSPDAENDVVEEGELVEPIGHVRVVYLGPVAPHWEVQSDYGPPEVIEQFRERVLARLVLLPPHDPQFRRNSERVVRDAEREQLALEWVLDYGEAAEAGGRRPGVAPGPASGRILHPLCIRRATRPTPRSGKLCAGSGWQECGPLSRSTPGGMQPWGTSTHSTAHASSTTRRR